MEIKEEENFSNNISALLHTGEHIFARSLQNLGLDIHVRKADTSKSPGVLIIKEIVSPDNLTKALVETNKIINLNLPVSVQIFDNLSAARTTFKNLRFNEERIDENKVIRVIKIGDFDVSACKNKHVDFTSKIIGFSILSISYLGGETTIKFLAGDEAVRNLSSSNGEMVQIAYENNIKLSDIRSFITKLRESLNELNSRLKQFALSILRYNTGFIDLRGTDISIFKDLIGKFGDYHRNGYIVIFSDATVIGVKSNDCKADLKSFAEKLKGEGVFIGNIKDDFFIGKVLDINKFLLFADHFVKLN